MKAVANIPNLPRLPDSACIIDINESAYAILSLGDFEELERTIFSQQNEESKTLELNKIFIRIANQTGSEAFCSLLEQATHKNQSDISVVRCQKAIVDPYFTDFFISSGSPGVMPEDELRFNLSLGILMGIFGPF